MQTVTLIINELPYKNNKAWNALRLAEALSDQGAQANIFLLEDGVDAGKVNQDTQEKKYNLE